jgi:hypothetical protein
LLKKEQVTTVLISKYAGNLFLVGSRVSQAEPTWIRAGFRTQGRNFVTKFGNHRVSIVIGLFELGLLEFLRKVLKVKIFICNLNY